MGGDGVGSSVIIALAAIMWFVYLVPTWLKRREYLATERNAVRLQQTMRILAESAELPSVVRVEATARTVAAQQRALRQQQRRMTARTENSFVVEAQRSMDAGERTRRRLRRSRVLATVVLSVAIVGGIFGISTAAVGSGWLMFGVSVAIAVGALALLGQAATVSRARADLRRAATGSAASPALHDEADYVPQRRAGWTPVPVPKPRYLSSPIASVGPRSLPTVQHVGVRDEFEHAAALRVASADAERALRAAQTAPEVTRISRPSTPQAAPAAAVGRFTAGRFEAMGVLDPAASNAADLDEILRRRRAAG